MCPVPSNSMVKRMMGHSWPKQLGRGYLLNLSFPLHWKESLSRPGVGVGGRGGTLIKGKEPGSLNHCIEEAAPACYNSYWSYCAELLTHWEISVTAADAP